MNAIHNLTPGQKKLLVSLLAFTVAYLTLNGSLFYLFKNAAITYIAGDIILNATEYFVEVPHDQVVA